MKRYLFLFIFIYLFPKICNGHTQTHSEVAFFDTLRAVVQMPETEQLDQLESMIPTMPNYFRVYTKYLERLYKFKHINRGIDYFKQSNDHFNPYYRCWMLAQLYDYIGERDSSALYYSKALADPLPPYALLRHAVKFADREDLHSLHTLLDTLTLPDTLYFALCGFRYFNSGWFDDAVRFYQRVGMSHLTPMALYDYGAALYRIGDIDRAEQAFRIIKKKSEQIGDSRNLAQTFVGLACTAYEKIGYEGFFYENEKAVRASRQTDAVFPMCCALHNLAIVYLTQDKLKPARHHVELAIPGFLALHEYGRALEAYICLGEIYENLYHYIGSLRCYNRAGELAKKQNNAYEYARLLKEKAELFDRMHAFQLAFKYFSESLDIVREHGYHNLEKELELYLLGLEMSQGHGSHSRPAMQRILKNDPDLSLNLQAYWLSEIADSYEAEGNLEQAEDYYKAAINASMECGSEYKEQFNRLELAHLFIQTGKIQEGMDICREVLAAVTEKTSNLMPLNAETYLASGFMAIDSCHQAIRHFKRSNRIFEKTASGFSADDLRIGFIDINLFNLRKISECYFRLYEKEKHAVLIDSLLWYEEHQRALVLKNKIMDRRNFAEQVRVLKQDSLYQNSCKKISAIQSKIRTANKDTAVIHRCLKQLEEEKLNLLMHKVNAQGRIKSGPRSVADSLFSTQALQSNLERMNSGLLCYHISGDQSFVVAVTDEYVNAIELPVDAACLIKAVDSLLAPFHNVSSAGLDSLAFHAKTAHQLYKWLIQPVSKRCNLPENLIIVRDAPLYHLPFDMLLTQATNRKLYYPVDSPDYADSFLLNEFSISYCPSMYFLTLKFEKSGKSILILANPTADESGNTFAHDRLRSQLNWVFNSLPFSELESRSIGKLFPQSKILKRRDAHEQAVRDFVPQADIVHFASHAFADTVYEAFSGVLLAENDSKTDDGILMGYEIEAMPLQCDLITLSACETGLGKVVRGEGIMSLPREFLYAGAQSVLMSFWKVDDEFTSRLMPRFYRIYRKQTDSKAKSLTCTKRSFLNEPVNPAGIYVQHPFFWASFSLYGHPGEPSSCIKGWMFIAGAGLLILAALFIFPRRRNVS